MPRSGIFLFLRLIARAAIAIAATASTTAAAISSPAASTARWTRFARLGLIDGERPAVHVTSVKRFDGGFGLGLARHFDKAKPSRAARLPVHHHLSP